MGKRALLLVASIAVASLAVACGRASEAEINQALGITPTPTASSEQLAAQSAAASATSAAAAMTIASPGAEAAAIGDVTRGRRQFTTQCAGCHRAGGAGPDILSPGGPGSGVTVDTLLPLLREGTGHPVPPGPYPPTRLSDGAVADIVAYVRDQAGS